MDFSPELNCQRDADVLIFVIAGMFRAARDTPES